jgi:hypothetical protein
MEQRVAVRYAGSHNSSCQLRKEETGGWLPAWVQDISATGINVLVEGFFEPGTPLLVEIENVDMQRRATLEMVVIHSVECPNGDWFHGGAFSRSLTRDELHAFAEGRI